MYLLNKYSKKNNFLMLINDDTVVLYSIIDDELEVKFTTKIDKAIRVFEPFIQEYSHLKIKIVLDPRYIQYKLISIPDIGSIKTQKAFNDLLKKIDDDILHSIVVHNPTPTDPETRFLIIKGNLNTETKKFLTFLSKNHISISNLHLGVLG